MSDAVHIQGVTKDFSGFLAVRDLDLTIGDGEFFSLLGPSGCGKTTTLRMIAGFEFPTTGSIKIHGVEMALQPPNHRPVNTVFQSYALFPHMTVVDNVAFGLRMKDTTKSDVATRAKRALDMVQLADRSDALAQATVRRHAAAGGPGPGVGQRTRGAAARRTARRPRPEASPGDAVRTEGSPGTSRDHLSLRHP